MSCDPSNSISLKAQNLNEIDICFFSFSLCFSVMVQIAGHGATTAGPGGKRSEIILFILQQFICSSH